MRKTHQTRNRKDVQKDSVSLKKVLVICGATATGKTRLAVECAKALSSEVISADSQLVYKGLNIGTAKPTDEEQSGVVHRMIDVIQPYEKFSVSDYRRTAKKYVDALIAENKVPVICGGTGFYINSLLFDYGYGEVAADENIRRKYQSLLEERGREYLFDLLKECDGVTAERLHPNDTGRVIRALEIYEAGGRKKSELCDGKNKLYDYLAVAIDYPREELYRRIENRVDDMIANGLIDEVKGLLKSGVDGSMQCMQAIGYKEVLEYIGNSQMQNTMSDIIKRNTRRYAKRQITFFKKLPDLVWLSPDEAISDRVMELLYE